MKIEVSNGEAVDRATILEIKLERLELAECDRESILTEWNKILDNLRPLGITPTYCGYKELRLVNRLLWDAVAEQDEMMQHECPGSWYEGFYEVATKVVKLNRSRYRMKCSVDEITKSSRREFKEETS